MRLVKVAQVTGEAGFVLLLSAPIAAMFSRQPLPPMIIGTAALAMLGTGMAVQLVALPSELDASFSKALPMLQKGYIDPAQVGEARKILAACSLTYVASSLVSVLNIWPWLGRGPGVLVQQQAAGLVSGIPAPRGKPPRPGAPARRSRPLAGKTVHGGNRHALLRTFGKPLIRHWMRLKRAR
jgi:hypothetical protein